MQPANQRSILFLDLDGILHSTDRELKGMASQTEALRVGMVRGEVDPATLGLLDPKRQQLLEQVLLKHPHADMVVSSAWRGWQGYNVKIKGDRADPAFEACHVETLNWLKHWLRPVIASRIIGKTPFGGVRLQELRYVMQYLVDPGTHCSRWVALDDQAVHFPTSQITPFYWEMGEYGAYATNPPTEEIVVLIDGQRALTDASAAALDAALTHASEGMAPEWPALAAASQQGQGAAGLEV